MFGVETPRVATPAHCLSICHQQREYLPSSNIVPRSENSRNSQDWVCLAVPDSEEPRRKARADFPFPCLSTGSSDDARPPIKNLGVRSLVVRNLGFYLLTPKFSNLVETVGVAPTTRCMQNSIAATEHAPPIKNLGVRRKGIDFGMRLFRFFTSIF